MKISVKHSSLSYGQNQFEKTDPTPMDHEREIIREEIKQSDKNVSFGA